MTLVSSNAFSKVAISVTSDPLIEVIIMPCSNPNSSAGIPSPTEKTPTPSAAGWTQENIIIEQIARHINATAKFAVGPAAKTLIRFLLLAFLSFSSSGSQNAPIGIIKYKMPRDFTFNF